MEKLGEEKENEESNFLLNVFLKDKLKYKNNRETDDTSKEIYRKIEW